MTLDLDDPRAVKAVSIAADAGRWLKVRTKDGRKAYGVPSSRDPHHVYLVTTRLCSCEDFRRRMAPCKHVKAVQLHVALVKMVENSNKYDEIMARFEGN
jgi:predicted nucleic acid-binding Zn finger protein